MHSIRKAARRQAWYTSDDDEAKTYNPFGRYRPQQKKKRDLEDGGALVHANTENDAGLSPVEEARRREMTDDSGLSPGVQKSGTFPSGPQGPLPKRSREFDEPIENSEASNSSEEKKLSEDQPDVDKSVGPVQHGEGKMRKRKLRKFMPWKKAEPVSEPEEHLTEEEEKEKQRLNPKLSIWSQMRVVLFSWVNILLVAVPVGIALEYSGVNKVAVFVVNFIAIIPLAGILAFSTEEMALYVGEVLGGLLNATFGNAVELIISIIALTQHKIVIVQTSLIGSMLSNLLLVLGMCFFFGGLRRTEQFFNVTVAQTAASLLALAIGSLIIPTAFKIFSHGTNGGPGDHGVPPLSRGTAVLLLITYGCYLLFQLRTHTDMYNEPGKKSPKKPSGRKEKGEVTKRLAGIGTGAAQASGGDISKQPMQREEEDEKETPQLTRVGAVVTLAVSTVFVALCAEYMVSAIGDVAKSISQEFIGLILLPIVGNAAEHATAVTVAIKDKMDLSIGVACGSSLQIALFVLPLMVLFNWWGVGKLNPGDPGFISQEESVMTLAFDGFQVSVLFIAIIVVNYLIQDGKSHWLEGVLLQITYLIIAVAAYFYPVSENLAG